MGSEYKARIYLQFTLPPWISIFHISLINDASGVIIGDECWSAATAARRPVRLISQKVSDIIAIVCEMVPAISIIGNAPISSPAEVAFAAWRAFSSVKCAEKWAREGETRPSKTSFVHFYHTKGCARNVIG